MLVLFRNWELKLLAVVVAVALWFLVVSGEKGEIAVAAPIQYVNVPPGLTLGGGTPPTVSVHLRGLRSVLGGVSDTDVRAEVNLEGVGTGDTMVRIDPENIRAPRGVTVSRVTPVRLHLRVERLETAWVRVLPRVVGAPAQGFRVKAVTAEPAVVQVQGPGEELSRWSEVVTAPVDVSGARRSISRALGLVAPSGTVRPLTRGVQVTVDITDEVTMDKGDRAR
jgi:YbbR domain-containing protein